MLQPRDTIDVVEFRLILTHQGVAPTVNSHKVCTTNTSTTNCRTHLSITITPSDTWHTHRLQLGITRILLSST